MSAAAAKAGTKAQRKREVLAIDWKQEHFLETSASIVTFTKNIVNENEINHRDISRQEVEWHWEGQVMKVFDRNSGDREPRLDQKLNGSDEDQKYQNKGDEFQQVKLTKADKKQDPFALAFQDRNGRLVVPDVGLLPLSEIHFHEIAVAVLKSNSDENISFHRMKAMFTALVYVYDFECGCKKSTTINEAANFRLHVYRQLVLEQKAESSKKGKRTAATGGLDDSSPEPESEKEGWGKSKQTQFRAIKAASTGLQAGASSSQAASKPSAETLAAAHSTLFEDKLSSTLESMLGVAGFSGGQAQPGQEVGEGESGKLDAELGVSEEEQEKDFEEKIDNVRTGNAKEGEAEAGESVKGKVEEEGVEEDEAEYDNEVKPTPADDAEVTVDKVPGT